jgi:hypothetical protein
MLNTDKIARPTAQLQVGDRIYFRSTRDSSDTDEGVVAAVGPTEYAICWDSDGETLTYPRGKGGIWTTARRDGEVLSWEAELAACNGV